MYKRLVAVMLRCFVCLFSVSLLYLKKQQQNPIKQQQKPCLKTNYMPSDV